MALGFDRAAQGRVQDDAFATAKKDEAQRAEQLNWTISAMQKAGREDLVKMAKAGYMKEAFNELMSPASETEAPSSVREWEYFNTLTPEQQSQYLTMKRSVPYLDLGPEYARPDPVTGQPTRTMTKDNFTPAFDAAQGTAEGKTAAETQAAFDSLNSKLPGIKLVVDELGTLAEQATYTQTGQLWDTIARETGAMPSEAAVARTKYIAMVDNQVLPLLRDTFGAAFTVKEGETLRATLGDPNKSPAEKKAVLEAFIEQKTRDLEALQKRLPSQPGPSTPATRLKFNPVTGDLE
jgi:hypothetical protein